jgi:hypothetical protein
MFHVDMSGETRRQIKLLFKQATVENRPDAFLAAFKQIIERLEQEPHELGEPLYHLQALQVQIRTAIVLPLSVNFSVSHVHHLVIIRNISLLSNNR